MNHVYFFTNASNLVSMKCCILTNRKIQKVTFLDVVSNVLAQNVHFQRLDDYQNTEAMKRADEIRAIDKEMAEIEERSRLRK